MAGSEVVKQAGDSPPHKPTKPRRILPSEMLRMHQGALPNIARAHFTGVKGILNDYLEHVLPSGASTAAAAPTSSATPPSPGTALVPPTPAPLSTPTPGASMSGPRGVISDFLEHQSRQRHVVEALMRAANRAKMRRLVELHKKRRREAEQQEVEAPPPPPAMVDATTQTEQSELLVCCDTCAAERDAVQLRQPVPTTVTTVADEDDKPTHAVQPQRPTSRRGRAQRPRPGAAAPSAANKMPKSRLSPIGVPLVLPASAMRPTRVMKVHG